MLGEQRIDLHEDSFGSEVKDQAGFADALTKNLGTVSEDSANRHVGHLGQYISRIVEE